MQLNSPCDVLKLVCKEADSFLILGRESRVLSMDLLHSLESLEELVRTFLNSRDSEASGCSDRL